MSNWFIYYHSGDGYVADGSVTADNEQEALWKARVLHPKVAVYVLPSGPVGGPCFFCKRQYPLAMVEA